MKRILIFLAIASSICFCFGMPRGTTQREFPDGIGVYDHASTINPDKIKSHRITPNPINREDWIVLDSLDLRTILPAGAQIGVQYHNPSHSFRPFANDGNLELESLLALDRAPAWLRHELANVLRQLSPENQNRWAAIINDAVDPYIDEIAFAVAHSSLAFLQYEMANPQLFVENAHTIYSIDEDLQYVQVIDYGTSTTDPDYYSTTQYRKYDSGGNLQIVEVPKEIYYWYIVHPKLTDEIPAYIDPSILENNSTHTNNIALPPTGKFWRSFLYEVQEETYPVLRDTLMQMQTLFNRNDDSSDAIHALQWWINQTMSFTSNNERPHQPVRIYRKHFGRCGEYADYTAAVARTALIPCTSILSMSTDHTWNEFWDEEWIMWEPVNGYINIPLVYEDGWGKVFGTVFEIRSDGYLSPVTGRYSSGLASITLSVVDADGAPVDGARVILAIFVSGYRVDMISFTDNNGLVVFPVGETNSYYARVESSIGIYPPVAGTYSALAMEAVDGGEYTYQLTIPNSKPVYEVTAATMPDDPVEDWKLSLSYSVPGYYISGRTTWDDISSTGVYGSFYYAVDEPGEVSMLLTDADNVIFWNDMQMCEAFAYSEQTAQGNFSFEIPVGSDYYAFLDNSHRLGNAQKIDGVILYEQSSTGADDQVVDAKIAALFQNHPNPFNPDTEIRFYLPQTQHISLDIYNLRGQLVKSLLKANVQSGNNSIRWDGKDDMGNDSTSGVYYYRLNSNGQSLTRKMLLVK